MEGRMFDDEGWDHADGSNLIGWKARPQQPACLPSARRRPDDLWQSRMSPLDRERDPLGGLACSDGV